MNLNNHNSYDLSTYYTFSLSLQLMSPVQLLPEVEYFRKDYVLCKVYSVQARQDLKAQVYLLQ
jgi:hypothetical protein